MYSRHATTCLILAVVHTSKMTDQNMQDAEARGMWHGDRTSDASHVVSFIMDSALHLETPQTSEIVTRIYMVGAFNHPSAIKASVVSAFNEWFRAHNDVRYQFDDNDIFKRPLCPEPPISRFTWRVVVVVNQTEASNCTYKRVKNGDLYSISCLMDDEDRIKDENIIKFNQDPSSCGGGQGVVLPFPMSTGLLVRKDFTYSVFHDSSLPPSPVDVSSYLSFPVPCEHRRNMSWLASRVSSSPSSMFTLNAESGKVQMIVPGYKVEPSEFVNSALVAFRRIDELAVSDVLKSDALRVSLMNNCSTSPWCEPEGFEEHIKVGMEWWEGGGGEEGGVYVLEEDRWVKGS